MKNTLVAVVLLLFAIDCFADVPPGYNLKVETDCGDTYNDVATVRVITDLPAQAAVVCSDGDYTMNRTDLVTFTIDAYYNIGGGGCTFYRRVDTRTYVVFVVVTIDDEGDEILQGPEQFTVTCSFDKFGSDQSAYHPVDDSYLAPLEIQKNMGPESPSTVSLYFMDLAGRVYQPGDDIAIMKGMKLVAESNGAGGEKGIRPVSCEAIDVQQQHMRYPILRAGCGDGLILAKHNGFNTTGLKTVSDAFSMFHVAKDRMLKIICNFTMCEKVCDGKSCSFDRNKRDSDGSDCKDAQSATAFLGRSRPGDVFKQSDQMFMIATAAFAILVLLSLIVLVVCLNYSLDDRKDDKKENIQSVCGDL